MAAKSDRGPGKSLPPPISKKESARHVRVVVGVPSVFADVPVYDPMLEEDQLGAPGGAPCAVYVPPDFVVNSSMRRRARHHGNEVAADAYGFSIRML